MTLNGVALQPDKQWVYLKIDKKMKTLRKTDGDWVRIPRGFVMKGDERFSWDYVNDRID